MAPVVGPDFQPCPPGLMAITMPVVCSVHYTTRPKWGTYHLAVVECLPYPYLGVHTLTRALCAKRHLAEGGDGHFCRGSNICAPPATTRQFPGHSKTRYGRSTAMWGADRSAAGRRSAWHNALCLARWRKEMDRSGTGIYIGPGI